MCRRSSFSVSVDTRDIVTVVKRVRIYECYTLSNFAKKLIDGINKVIARAMSFVITDSYCHLALMSLADTRFLARIICS